MDNKAICITLGEQSENHVGMVKYGNGLSEKGYTTKDLFKMKEKFEKLGCQCEIINLDSLILKDNNEDAKVLVIRNCVDTLLGKGESKNLVEDLIKLKWDTKYWDTRRQKVLNKRARYNLCFGKEDKSSDFTSKSGSVISYDNISKLKNIKQILEEIAEEKNLECEGNYYYDAKKCGIGFHGDAERKKVIGISLSTDDIVREINWIWYENYKRVSEKKRVQLFNGDCYIMNEKSTGFDWKRKSILTLRHAAGVPESKYLK